MSFRLVPKSVTLNDRERRNGVILRFFSANSRSFRAHCVKVHVRYLISWCVLVNIVNRGYGFGYVAPSPIPYPRSMPLLCGRGLKLYPVDMVCLSAVRGALKYI